MVSKELRIERANSCINISYSISCQNATLVLIGALPRYAPGVTKSLSVVMKKNCSTRGNGAEWQSFPMPLDHYYGVWLPHKASTNQRQCCESPSLIVATNVTIFDHGVKCKPKVGVSHTVSQPPPDHGHLDDVSTMEFLHVRGGLLVLRLPRKPQHHNPKVTQTSSTLDHQDSMETWPNHSKLALKI
jgi:hypothetical protein